MATLPPIITIQDPLGFLTDLTALAETHIPNGMYTKEQSDAYRQTIADIKSGEIIAVDTLPQSEALANDLVDRLLVQLNDMLRIYDRFSIPPPPAALLAKLEREFLKREAEENMELMAPQDPFRI